MWARPNKLWLLLLLPLAALIYFLAAYFHFQGGGYDAPEAVSIPLEGIPVPSSSILTFTEVPKIQRGTLVLDATHSHSYTKAEITTLTNRVADRGFDVEYLGDVVSANSESQRLEALDVALRKADSMAVILPRQPYTPAEAALIEQFVDKGGRLLLIADPTRPHRINSLAQRFGISFLPGHLYNTTEYDLNHQNIFLSDFPRTDELTQGLRRIVMYTSGSVRSAGPGLVRADTNTRSSTVHRIEPFYPVAKGRDGRVVAIFDLTFMIPPQNSILDNDRFISNIADYLTSNIREFHLTDFPYFFGDQVDLLLGQSALFEVGSDAKTLLAAFGKKADIKPVEDITSDTMYLGLYEDSFEVAQYLQLSGIQLDGSLRTPFTSEIDPTGTATIFLQATPDRHVLVVLGESPAALKAVLNQLESGTFRNGLVGDFVGVYRN